MGGLGGGGGIKGANSNGNRIAYLVGGPTVQGEDTGPSRKTIDGKQTERGLKRGTS